MQYDLEKMVKAKNPRWRRRSIKIRGAALRFEHELEAILLEVVEFWTRASKTPELMTDAEPDAVRSVVNETFLASIVLKIRTWFNKLARWMQRLFTTRIQQVTGIDISGLTDMPTSSPSVVETLGWLEELVDDLSQQTKHRITSAMADARLRQLPAVQALSAVTEAVAKAKNRAKSIAGDMTGKLSQRMNQSMQAEAGITRYKWNHSFRPNPRRHHVERQGNIYEWAKPPSDGHPGYAYHCRCTAEPVI